jgi:hypothetical protein
VPDTAASGIVAEDLGAAEDTGLLLAHEIGHFLGLRHTTDDGGATDPIADTPECAAGTVFEECADYTNVMFPFFPLGGDHVLTEGQARVLRANPFLREERSDALCPGTPAYDVTSDGTARGETTSSPVKASASCGGTGTPERTHIYRVLRDDAQALSVRVTTSVNATVSITLGCAGAELACAATEAGVETELTIETPARGAYAIVIDGDATQFALEVDEL